MKRNTGLYLILLSFAITTIGSILKIKHSPGSEIMLAVGVLAFVVGLAFVLYQVSKRKST